MKIIEKNVQNRAESFLMVLNFDLSSADHKSLDNEAALPNCIFFFSENSFKSNLTLQY